MSTRYEWVEVWAEDLLVAPGITLSWRRHEASDRMEEAGFPELAVQPEVVAQPPRAANAGLSLMAQHVVFRGDAVVWRADGDPATRVAPDPDAKGFRRIPWHGHALVGRTGAEIAWTVPDGELVRSAPRPVGIPPVPCSLYLEQASHVGVRLPAPLPVRARRAIWASGRLVAGESLPTRRGDDAQSAYVVVSTKPSPYPVWLEVDVGEGRWMPLTGFSLTKPTVLSPLSVHDEWDVRVALGDRPGVMGAPYYTRHVFGTPSLAAMAERLGALLGHRVATRDLLAVGQQDALGYWTVLRDTVLHRNGRILGVAAEAARALQV